MASSTSRRLSRLIISGGIVSLTTFGLPNFGPTAMAQTPTTEPSVDASDVDPAPEASTSEESDNDSEAMTSRFTCQMQNGQYTVMYAPSSQPEQMYPWAIPQEMGSAWPAERRCQEISARLEAYRSDGLLVLNTGVENGYNTVCVTTEAVPDCRIVFTVPPGQDAVITRNQVFENLTVADQGQPTQGVNTFASGEGRGLGQLVEILRLPPISSPVGAGIGGINLTPFLDPADGGTGARLTNADRSVAPGPSLNPDNFR